MKTCKICGINKGFSEFHKNKYSKDGHRNVCRSCTKKQQKERYLKNRKAILLRTKGYNSTNKESISLRMKKYYIENREKLQKYQQEYETNNKDKNYERVAKRRAIKEGATPIWFTIEDQVKIKDLFNMAKNLYKLTGIRYEIDHIVPLKSAYVCGLHCIDNLQIIPTEDNRSKGNRWWPDMW